MRVFCLLGFHAWKVRTQDRGWAKVGCQNCSKIKFLDWRKVL